MKQDLPLYSLEIKGYRGIRHLQLPTLEQVNLFVGVNNVGKTSLLESIRIQTEPQPVSVLWELLRQRNKHNRFRSALLKGQREPISEEEIAEAARAVEMLFYRGVNSPLDPQAEFTSSGRLGLRTRIFLPWWEPSGGASGEPAFFGSEEDPLIFVQRDELLSHLSLKGFFGYVAPGDDAVVSIGVEGFDGNRLTALWSRAAASGEGPAVEEAFRRFLPEAKRIHVLFSAGSFSPVIAIELEGRSRPVPLSEMGDGTRRVLSIVLAMVQASGGVVLIDEVENGLHYSVQQEVWRAIFHLAEQLAVQVFATTHSWDAIQAFSLAASEALGVEGRMHRLENRDGDIRQVEFDEEDLAIVTRQRIEVR
jgi:predicted ATPase